MSQQPAQPAASDIHLVLIGCGKMGGAMLESWIAHDVAVTYSVIDPYGLPENLKDHHNIQVFETVVAFEAARSSSACVFILAVKPQIMRDVCLSLKSTLTYDDLVLSIAAGQTIGSFETYFSAAQPIIRTMPNTPAAIGEGITVCVANGAVNDHQRAIATNLCAATGDVEWITDERDMNAVTALSGSGPAYVFLLIEAMTKAGIACGLPADLAARLARKTVVGSAALVKQSPQTEPSTLRENVTSPNGTTAAALEVLMNENGIQPLFNKALLAAQKRGEELAKEDLVKEDLANDE